MLTEKERTFLIKVRDKHNNFAIVIYGKENSYKSLVDRGYLKFSEVRIGPLAVKTGETGISVTEAGLLAIINN